ncbi:hypothetical protein [Novosphingobium sp. EMRT-2]|nr:hypothetical protein [Novosphingobium sp. EMRT-2]
MEIKARFDEEMANLLQQTNSAYGSVATSVEQRAELETRNVELARCSATITESGRRQL